jgi:acyl-CoA synthetase (NDP forming)
MVKERAGGAPGRALIDDAVRAGSTSLDEATAKALFRAYGIPVALGDAASSLEQAVAIAADLGYPVVLKGLSQSVLHKSDAGLVLLDIRDEQGLRSGYDLLRQRSSGGLDGVLVERFLPPGREFVAGLFRDRQFGPVVMFGLGGVLTEALDDVAFAVAPLSRHDALGLLDSINARRLLGAFRGAPAVDREELCDILVALGRMGLDHPEVAEVDINPLLVEAGHPVAVDALVGLGSGVAPSIRPSGEEACTANLDAVFNPRSVAVVGASNDPMKWGGTILASLLSGGYPGPVYRVNPHGGEIFGAQAYRSIEELPEGPDLVLVAVPAPAVKGVVESCGRRGSRAVVVISSGFSELDEAGAAMERELAETARAHGIALIGPNCMGVMSSWSRFFATGAMVIHPSPGPGSFISQSGNMGIQLMAASEQRKAGMGKFVGVGNEALIGTTDLFAYFGDDPQTGVVLAYMEGVEDGRRLLEVARRTALRKPVVLLHAGESEEGQRAAASHTGAMAGSARVFAGVVRQTGIVATTDPDEFLDLALGFSYLPLPRGRRIGVVTVGGGWGVISADEVARSGLELATLPPTVIDEISSVLPGFWSHGNPVDLVGTLKPGAAETAVKAVVASDAVDSVVVLGVIGMLTAPLRAIEEAKRLREAAGVTIAAGELPDGDALCAREARFIADMGSLMNTYSKPIVSVSFTPFERAVFPGEGRYASIVLPSPLRSVRILANMADYAAHLEAAGVAR